MGRNAARSALIAVIADIGRYRRDRKTKPFNHKGHEGTLRDRVVACGQEISRSERKWRKGFFFNPRSSVLIRGKFCFEVGFG
jgi:hypothetical protein